MLVCEGRVTTLWAWVLVNTRPCPARRSSTGVCDWRLPANPGASARSVSMVMRTTSPRVAAGRAGAFAVGVTATARARTATRARDAKSHFDMAGDCSSGPEPLTPQPVHDRLEPLHQGRQVKELQAHAGQQVEPAGLAGVRLEAVDDTRPQSHGLGARERRVELHRHRLLNARRMPRRDEQAALENVAPIDFQERLRRSE